MTQVSSSGVARFSEDRSPRRVRAARRVSSSARRCLPVDSHPAAMGRARIARSPAHALTELARTEFMPGGGPRSGLEN